MGGLISFLLVIGLFHATKAYLKLVCYHTYKNLYLFSTMREFPTMYRTPDRLEVQYPN